MIKLLKRIYGAPESALESLAVIERAGDAMFYTEEEKARDSANRLEQRNQFLLNWMESTKGQNLSRRLLAMLVGGVWAIIFIFSWMQKQLAFWSITFEWWEIGTQSKTEVLKSVDALNQPYLDSTTAAMMLVLGFYFAAPHMGAFVESIMQKFGGTKNADR